MSQRDSFLSKNNNTTNKSLEFIQKIINDDNVNSYSNDNHNSGYDDNDNSQSSSSSSLSSLPTTPNSINKITTNQHNHNHNNLSTPLSASTSSSSTTTKSKIHTSGYANSISTILSKTNNSFSTLRYYIPETVSTDRIFTLERILGYTGGPAVILYESKY
jgi:hypothetical protein